MNNKTIAIDLSKTIFQVCGETFIGTPISFFLTIWGMLSKKEITWTPSAPR